MSYRFYFNIFIVLVACIYCYQAESRVFTPVLYSVSLDFSKFSAQDNRIFSGVTTIYFNVSENTYGLQEILLDSELLNIYEAQVIDSNNNAITVVQSNNENLKQSIWIKIDNDVVALKVIIKYQGPVGRVGDTGVYITDKNNIIATNSYPLGVRKIFPCVNDPEIRTPFKLDVKLVNSKWGIHRLTDGLQSPSLPAYAVGFIMTLSYRKVDGISNNRINVWVPSFDNELYNSVNNNKILKDLLADGTYFHKFFEPSSMDKIHIVMVDGIPSLSLVNHRLISIRRDFLISSNRETAEMAKGTAVAMINALAKHFFRCVVSPNNWQDFWLADSVALYLQYALLNDKIFHDFNFPELFMTDMQRPTMRGSGLSVNPESIDPNLLSSSEIYPSVYQGASVLKMLEPLSSQDAIVDDLFNYFTEYVYKNVDTEEFLMYMSRGSMFKTLNEYGKTLNSVLDKWIHSVGYPFITNVQLTRNNFTITQMDYFSANSSSAHWVIPFDYQNQVNSNSNLEWLSGATTGHFQFKNVASSWVLLNKDSKGLFRVNYGERVAKLIDANVYWSLSDLDRAALIDDSFDLAWKQVDGSNLGFALELFDTLANETYYSPFSLAMNHVNLLRHLLTQKSLERKFELKIAEILDNAYSKIDWFKRSTVNIAEDMWTRVVVQSACEYSVSTCQYDSSNAYISHSKVLNDLDATVNCYQVRRGKQEDWVKQFNQMYKVSDTQYERADALYALACPENTQSNGSYAISLYLKKINSDAILPEDASRAFQYIYSRREHINQAMMFIYREFTSLILRFGDSFMADLINGIGGYLLPKDYNNILDSMKSFPKMQSKTYMAILNTQAGMARRDQVIDANLYQIQNWMDTNYTTYKPLPPPTTTTATTVLPTNATSSGNSFIMNYLHLAYIYSSLAMSLLINS